MVSHFLANEPLLQHKDQISVLNNTMTDLPDALLQASLTLTDPVSLQDLEHKLDLWLGLLYAPYSWTLTYSSQGGHVPLVMMEGQQGQSSASGRLNYVHIMPIGVAPHALGSLELTFTERPPER